MALSPLRPRLRNVSNGLAKIQISIPAGDEIEVSEEVAAQIAHQGAPLRDGAPALEAPAEPEPEPALEAPAEPEPEPALEAPAEPEPEPEPEADAEERPKPARKARAAKKASA